MPGLLDRYSPLQQQGGDACASPLPYFAQQQGLVFFFDRIEGERTFSGRRIAETAPPP
jgi:hypothetical protein